MVLVVVAKLCLKTSRLKIPQFGSIFASLDEELETFLFVPLGYGYGVHQHFTQPWFWLHQFGRKANDEVSSGVDRLWSMSPEIMGIQGYPLNK